MPPVPSQTVPPRARDLSGLKESTIVQDIKN